MQDSYETFTCVYSGTANNNAQGLNVTMVVLGPYNSADNVDVVYRTSASAKQSVKANYIGARDSVYNVSHREMESWQELTISSTTSSFPTWAPSMSSSSQHE